MSPKKTGVLCLLIFFLCSGFLAAGGSATAGGAKGSGVTINSGHNQVVSFLDHSPSGHLFSAADDGTLKVWDPRNGNLLYDHHLSYTGFRLAALNPARPEIAVITSDTLNSFVLTVWNWETREKRFSIKLPELPLFLQYSPGGSYLVYGITNWNSLTFIDSSSGGVLPYLTEGFGIVSSAFIAASEKIILTYSPSGSIQYWDMEQGTMRTRLSTQSNLANIVFTPNGRYMAASDNRNLYYIDLTTGSQVDRRPIGDILALTMTENGELISYSRSSGGFLLSRFDTKNNNLSPVTSYPNFPLRNMGKMAARNDTLFLSDPEGTIHKFDLEQETTSVFSQSQLKKIDALEISGKNVVIAGGNEILSLDRDFFLSLVPGSTEEMNFRRAPLPFSGVPGLTPYADGQFIVWTRDGSRGSLALFSPDRGTVKTFDNYPYAFADAAVQGTKIATLDKNGECRILDLARDTQEFQFTSFGLQSISFTADGNLLVGRSKSGELPASLLHVNTRTGETVPLEDDNLRISHLALDPFTGFMYSLGIEERRGRIRTVLKLHRGQNFGSADTLLTYLGEALASPLCIQEDGTRVFISLGAMGTKMFYWGGFTDFETPVSPPAGLAVLDRFLVGLGSDNSISFWDKASGKLAFTFYLFKDNEWAAVFPGGDGLPKGGGYAASPGASRYVRRD